ncbi:hypothetical protein GCM10028805_34120 [Spirosoma harenae]
MMQNSRSNQEAAHFYSLPYNEQLKLVWQQGRLIEARRIPGFWLHLYAISTFFVEMWVCQRRYDVELVRLLNDTDELEPYIDKISLNELFPD